MCDDLTCMVKLYKNLVNSVAGTLQDIFLKNKQADKALEKLFKLHPQWGSRDRRFVAEAVYDIVRHYRLYSELAESKNNFWFITAVWLVIKYGEIPDWQEFKHVDIPYILSRKQELSSNLPVSESFPDWLWELGSQELGAAEWQREALAMNVPAELYVRVNTLKANVDQVMQTFTQQDIAVEMVPDTKSCLKITKRQNLFQHKLFKDGWFEIQDGGSQMISEFVDPKPAETILDACAGAGGKSLHLAALMKNKGKIISMDVEGWKLEELKKRAKRGGAHNIETRVIESATILSLASKADKLLLDVPCSGTGVLKRNPDAKWKLSHDTIKRTQALQKQILNDYSVMVKSGGELIYSTCSILPSENQEQIKEFLKTHPEFEFKEEKMLFPSQGFDGFYMARLMRKSKI